MSMWTQLSATSHVEDGALGHFFLAVLELLVVAEGVDDEEGTGGNVVSSLFSMGLTAFLPLSSSTIAPLLAPFTQGN
jgi:hypothetical protein